MNKQDLALTSIQKRKKAAVRKNWRRNHLAEWKLAALTYYGPDGQLRCSWPQCIVDDVDMLALDHIQNDGAKNRAKRGGWEFYYRLIRLGFPDGLQTLCHNHNWKKEIMRRREERTL